MFLDIDILRDVINAKKQCALSHAKTSRGIDRINKTYCILIDKIDACESIFCDFLDEYQKAIKKH